MAMGVHSLHEVSAGEFAIRPVASNNADGGLQRVAKDFAARLAEWFGSDFAVVNAETGELLDEPKDHLIWDGELRPQLCREVLHRNRAEFIHEAGPLLVLAVPLDAAEQAPLVALGTFSTALEFTASEAEQAA